MSAFVHAALRWFSPLLPILLVLARTTPSAAQIVPQDVAGLEITPDGSTIIVAPNTSGHLLEFMATNQGSTGGTWSFSCSRTGNVTCGTVVPTSRTLASGAGGEVAVTFNAQGGGTGRITLTASPGGETGYVDVDVAEPGPPSVALRNHNRDNVDRSLCLTAGAGESAAWSCGDLLITHPMPGYNTMNRERMLTLMHNSATADPRPAVAVAVNQTGRTLPQNGIYAELKVGAGGGTLQDSATYTGWSTGPGKVKQLVLDFSAASFATGAYPVEVNVRNQYTGASYTTTVRDTLLIINRSAGEFGAGFGIAGVEQLFLNQPVGTTLGHLLWVGGDGSAKLYRKLVDPTKWEAALGAFRDTISLSGSTYTRKLRHGVQVQFDATGRHTATINRTGQTTTFSWQSTPSGLRLQTVAVPPSGQSLTYTLGWDGSDKLAYIRDPALRILSVTVAAGRLTVLQDPDGYQTQFGYDTKNRIISRRNRLGWTTTYEYSKGLARGSRVTKVTFPIGRTSDAQTAATVFEPWNDKGLNRGVAGLETAVDTSQAQTIVRGPRANVPDDATFWVDRWGAPTKITNAVPATTTLLRGNASFPALVTRITHPNGRITEQFYNSRGNLTKVRDDITPITGDPPRRIREYKYTDTRPKVIDSPTEVWDSVNNGLPTAAARKTRYHYTTDGLTDTLYDTKGHRTSFTYRTGSTDPLKGMLIRITEHSVETWEETSGAADDAFQWRDHEVRIDYDLKGNLQADTSAVGAVTSYARDTKGRVTNVYDPLKTRTERVYDDMNRVTSLKHYTQPVAHPLVTNPLTPCQGNQALCSDNTQNWDPLPNPVNTTYTQGAMHLEAVQDHRGVARAYDHDTRGLVIGETDDYGGTGLAFYNEAGLMTSSTARTGGQVRSYYDAAGRRTAMAYDSTPSLSGVWVPGDSIRYTYDNMDNLLTVTNREGTITRLYMRNGLVKRKTMDFIGANQPDDVVTYVYDETGALRTITHGSDATTYNYAPATGELTTMVVQLGAPANLTRTFTFEWDSLGRRKRIDYPTNAAHPMAVEFRYDKAGVLRRLVSNHQGGASQDNVTFTYRNVAVDPIGRVVRDSLTCAVSTAHGSPCQGVSRVTVANAYSRMGALLRQLQTRGSTPYSDSMSYDASGNMLHRKQGFLNKTHSFSLDAVGGPHNRLASFARSEVNNSTRIVEYNSNGSRVHEARSPWVESVPERRWYYYDGLGRMTGTAEWVLVSGNYFWSERPTACQYDGDGEMIGPCENGSHFLTFDGHNTSGTVQGSEGWHFFHGPGLDDPLLGYYRGGAGNRLYLWVTDGHGREFAVADTMGQRSSSDDAVSHLGEWHYAGSAKKSNSFDADRFASVQAPKLSFFRNRAYDQETGRWTQEDPIGLAGGANLYQFNGNDPVTFTDPFGLKECEQKGNCTQADGGQMRILSLERARADAIESTDLSPLFFIGGIQKEAAGGAAGAVRLVSRIKDSPALVRVAGQLEGTVQESVNRLVGQLAKGNLNPGIGTRFLFNGVFEARARDGARVYFRNAAENTVEILGKSTKATQDQVINVLESLYK